MSSPANHSFNDPLGIDSTAPPKKVLTGVLIGFCLGFFIAAGAIVVIRGMDSETDGFNALTQALMVFIPLLVLLAIVWFLRRNVPGNTYKPGVFAAMVAGLIGGGLIWFTCPTEQQRAEELLALHIDLVTKRATQLAAFHDKVESIPKGGLRDFVTEEQAEKLKTAPMVFGYDRWGLPENWNALLTADAEYARLKVGTDPDSIMDSWDMPKCEFPIDDRYGEPVDEIAEAAFGVDSYMFHDEIECMIETVEQMRYVAIVRMTERNPPVLTGEEFKPGYLQGEAFFFDLHADEMIGAFVFGCTNADEVEYTYAENSSVTDVANSAAYSLEQDLDENRWLSFWHKLHAVAENAKSEHKNDELPYAMSSLDEAMLIWIKDREIREREENEVREQLEQRGVSPSDG